MHGACGTTPRLSRYGQRQCEAQAVGSPRTRRRSSRKSRASRRTRLACAWLPANRGPTSLLQQGARTAHPPEGLAARQGAIGMAVGSWSDR